MKTKHTPGPWSVDEIWGLIFASNGELEVAAVHGGSGHAKETKANARLIAAAPDMLETLKKTLTLLEAIEKETGYVTYVTQLDTKKLIAKAEGNTDE